MRDEILAIKEPQGHHVFGTGVHASYKPTQLLQTFCHYVSVMCTIFSRGGADSKIKFEIFLTKIPGNYSHDDETLLSSSHFWYTMCRWSINIGI